MTSHFAQWFNPGKILVASKVTMMGMMLPLAP